MKKYLSELIGTFSIVFCGTAAIVVHELTGAVSHEGVATTFGLIVMVMIYAFGGISGAHFNPAVTFAFWCAGRFDGRMVAPYMVSQFTGAILASMAVLFLFPGDHTLGTTLPFGEYLQAFLLEIILSFFLMLVIINVSTGAKETGIMAGIAIGGTVLLEAMFAGPVSGASMNPARSLAPALLSGETGGLWIYLTAPFIGTALAIGACIGVKGKDCCPTPHGACK